MDEDDRIKEAGEALKIGDLLVDQGKLDAALAVFQTGLDLNRLLAADFPQQLSFWREQSVCHDRIGDTLMKLDRLEEALAAYQLSVRLSTLLARTDASDIGLHDDLAIGHNNVGNALLALDRPGEALESFEEGVAVRAGLVEAHPDDAVVRRQLMANLIKLAQMSPDAANCYERAHEQAVWLAQAGKLKENESSFPELLARKAAEAKTAAPKDDRS